MENLFTCIFEKLMIENCYEMLTICLAKLNEKNCRKNGLGYGSGVSP
jgi:hypothetical protein